MSLLKLSLSCLGQFVAFWMIHIHTSRIAGKTEEARSVAEHIRFLSSERPVPEFFCSQSSSATITKFERSSPSELVGKSEGDLCRMPPQPTECCVGCGLTRPGEGHDRDATGHYVGGLPTIITNNQCCDYCYIHNVGDDNWRENISLSTSISR